ncbi:hypothetical protein ERJ75_001395700 [Trypanosoma vivax]|nr:hypothetical protein ERJ75_001395700 [Trypanosoma vivax]
MHKLALAVFCVIAARSSQRALAGEPNAGDTVEDFRKVCAATHALGAVKSLSEAIAGRVKEVTEGARRVGEELECQLRIKRSARQLVAKLAPSCIDSSEAETAQKNASALVVCAADAINGEAVKLKNTAGTAAAEVIDGNKDGKVEGGAALARLWSAISRGTNNAWDGQAHKMRGSGLAIAMIYLCNNANPDPNGCGTSGGRNCPCVPQGFTAKTSDEERSTVETTPRIIHTGRQNKDGKKDSGEWTKLTHNTRMTAEELRTNLGAAKRICDALEDTTKQNLNTADTIEQTVTALVRAMKRTDEEGEARCLGRMDEANGWDGSSGEKGACICYKTPGKNTTAISWASKALTAVRALRSLLRTEQQAAQLNTLAAAWAGTQEHTQQHTNRPPRTRRTAATAREHTSTPTASPRDNSHNTSRTTALTNKQKTEHARSAKRTAAHGTQRTRVQQHSQEGHNAHTPHAGRSLDDGNVGTYSQRVAVTHRAARTARRWTAQKRSNHQVKKHRMSLGAQTHTGLEKSSTRTKNTSRRNTRKKAAHTQQVTKGHGGKEPRKEVARRTDGDKREGSNRRAGSRSVGRGCAMNFTKKSQSKAREHEGSQLPEKHNRPEKSWTANTSNRTAPSTDHANQHAQTRNTATSEKNTHTVHHDRKEAR